jgi:hypothetical protein
MEVRLQGLKGPMPIYPERSDRPSSNRCGLRKRLGLECEMLNRFALPT